MKAIINNYDIINYGNILVSLEVRIYEVKVIAKKEVKYTCTCMS